MWKFVSVLVFLFITVSSLPIESDTDKATTPTNENLPTLATELLPPREDAEIASFADDLIAEHSSPSRELLPPVEGTLHKGVVFLINLYAIKNQTGENPSEILTDDVIKNNPGLLEPVATVLLVLEEEDQEKPVSLDELAKDLEEEGFTVEKLTDDGDTKVIKVDLDSSLENSDVELINGGKVNSLRKKRSPHGLLSKLLNKHNDNGGGGYGGGCQGGCGGGYPSGGAVGVIPIVIVPVQGGHQQPQYNHQQPQYNHPQPQYQPPPQYVERPQYHPQPQYIEQPHYSQPQQYPSGGQCNTCGGNHGSHSQSSAQASAQSSSSSW